MKVEELIEKLKKIKKFVKFAKIKVFYYINKKMRKLE